MVAGISFQSIVRLLNLESDHKLLLTLCKLCIIQLECRALCSNMMKVLKQLIKMVLFLLILLNEISGKHTRSTSLSPVPCVPSILKGIYTSTHPPTHFLSYPSIHLLIHPSIYSSIHSSTHPSIHLLIHPFI